MDRAKGIHLKERLEKKYGPGEVMFIACDVTSSSQMKGKSEYINTYITNLIIFSDLIFAININVVTSLHSNLPAVTE